MQNRSKALRAMARVVTGHYGRLRNISSGRIPCAHRAGPVAIKAAAARLSPYVPQSARCITRQLSRRGRTLCAPTEHDVFLSSGRIALHKFRQPNTQRSACVFGPSLNQAPTVRDRERSKPPGKRFALWPVWSRATTDGCILPRSGHYGSTESFHCYLKNTFIFRRSNH